MDPSYNNSFGSPIVSGATNIAPKSNKKWFFIGVIGVIVALTVGVILVLMNNKSVEKKNTSVALNEYVNYLLTGELLGDDIDINNMWSERFYKSKFEESDSEYFRKAQELLARFKSSFEKEYKGDESITIDSFDYIVNVSSQSSEYLSAVGEIMDVGVLTKEDIIKNSNNAPKKYISEHYSQLKETENSIVEIMVDTETDLADAIERNNDDDIKALETRLVRFKAELKSKPVYMAKWIYEEYRERGGANEKE